VNNEFQRYEEDDDWVSKSQVKRETAALQAMGMKLIEFNEKQLSSCDLPQELIRAVLEAKKIKSNLAQKRQAQYIGKLIRKADMEQIKTAIARAEHSGPQVAAEMKQLNNWRDRLLDEGKQALTDYLNEFNEVDVQHLRHLIRDAKKERDSQTATGAGKKLFRFLRDAL
jgi:ribosome-associated protein